MIYLNRALDVFNTAVVTPLLYVIFTGCVILASAVLFREWRTLSVEDIVGNFCGLLVIVAGIFLLQAFRELDVSVKNLPRARKNGAKKVEAESSSLTPTELTGPGDEPGLSRSNSGSPLFNNVTDYHSRANTFP